ncbi:MAG: FAD-binding oxidoreductase [Hyphomicrobiaceae bacterium]|nr:FAD-binding oxidoreductase [Hyphomicrobiaceae bacterium]
MTRRFDAIVVGCGIAGAATAFFLARRGMAIAVYDRDGPASGGTGLSAAIVRQHYSTPLMARMAKAAVDIFRDAASILGRDAGYRRVGYVFLTPPDALDATRRVLAMQQELGIASELIGPDDLVSRLPWLDPDGVAAAAFEPDGGFADPETATTAFLEAAREKGAVAYFKTPVRGLMRRGDRITGILTDEGEVIAGIVVNAAGPWAAPLAASAGLPLTMRAVREQDTVWEARPDRPLPATSVSNAVDAIYVRPLGNRRFIVGRGFPKAYADVDPYNYKRTADPEFIADVQQRLTTRMPGFEGARLIHSYAALYDVTADWYQYVGPREGIAGYADFNGGSGHGFKVAPAIAQELAGWLAEGTVADDFRRLSHDRVARNELFVQSYGGNRG